MIGFVAIVALVYGLDLITKILVRKNMPLGAEIDILPFFALSHSQNTGIAFGLFQDNNFYFLMAGLVVTVALVILARRLMTTDRTTAYLIALVLGGALGNLTDRFVYGSVTDFLDFYWMTHHWPTFNVADSAICVGAVSLVLIELLRKKDAPDSV